MVRGKVPIRRVYAGNREIEDAARTGHDAARQVNRSIFAGGVLIDSEPDGVAGAGLLFVAATARSIAHGLGRKAVGWIEVYGVDLPSAGQVGLFSSPHPSGLSSATHVTVTPTNTGTCFLFVY